MSQTKTLDESLDEVETVLGHRFANRDLLRDALTHRSFANERPKQAPSDNERLEFLGDSLVGFVVAAMLYERYPDATEGDLSLRRAELVCEAGLAAIARELRLGDALRLGRGAVQQGARDKPRLLASAFEACCGAIFLDAGEAVAAARVRAVFVDRLASSAGDRDFKSKVQELVQGRGLETPRYVVLEAIGPDHDRVFEVAIEVGGEQIATARGRTKTEAEQAAAAEALALLAPEPPGDSA